MTHGAHNAVLEGSIPSSATILSIPTGGQRMTTLTPKQEAFCQAYTSSHMGNATGAARSAGYKGSPNTLAQVGAENLKKPHIQARIDELMAPALEEYELTRADVLRRMVQVFDAAMEDRDLPSANKSVELQGKTLALFTEKHEHTADDALTALLAAVSDTSRGLPDGGAAR